MTMKNAARISAAVLLFVVFVGQAVTEAYEPPWKPGADSEFEVGTQLRPWTIWDVGIDAILDNCQSMAGVNNIYLIVIMHQEHRPFQAKKFPHNPVRETFMAEDSTVTWSPDMKRYGKIKPRLSKYDWIRETDWLQLTVDACRKRGLGVGAEISHFPMPKSMRTKDSRWIQKDVHGDPVSSPRFCCHHPEVRQYILGLFGDLAANYDLDYIQTCQYLGGECFCEHCIQAAKALGFNMEAAIPALQKKKDAEPHCRHQNNGATWPFRPIRPELSGSSTTALGGGHTRALAARVCASGGATCRSWQLALPLFGGGPYGVQRLRFEAPIEIRSARRQRALTA